MKPKSNNGKSNSSTVNKKETTKVLNTINNKEKNYKESKSNNLHKKQQAKEKQKKTLNSKSKSIKQKKFKTYRQQLKSEMFEIDNELVLNRYNDAVIECKVGKIENIFSPYDIAKNRSINEPFHVYLMQEAEIIPSKHDIELKMLIDSDITEEQELQIKKAIKRHYRFVITTSNLILRKNAFASLLLYLGGALTLLLNFLADNIITNIPIKEAMLISTWFFLWEATSKAFFDRNELKHDRYNMLRIYNARVVFVKTNETKNKQ